MAYHTYPSSSPLGYESSSLGDNLASTSCSQIPNKTLHIANLPPIVEPYDNQTEVTELKCLLKSQPGFRRLKILKNRNKIGCFALAYYIDISSAGTAMLALQGAPVIGYTDGLEISFATTPKTSTSIGVLSTFDQDRRASITGGNSSLTSLKLHSSHSKIPTSIGTPLASATRVSGVLGDKIFAPLYTRSLGRSYRRMENGNIGLSGSGSGSGDLVYPRTGIQPAPRDEQENILFPNGYTMKAQDEGGVITNSQDYTNILESMSGLALEGGMLEATFQAGNQKHQEDIEKVRRGVGFQFEKNKEEGMIAKVVMEIVEGESREKELEGEKGAKILTAYNSLETPIGNKNTTEQAKEDPSEPFQEVTTMSKEDWMNAFEF